MFTSLLQPRFLGVLVLGVFIGYGLSLVFRSNSDSSTLNTSTPISEKVLYWYDPMEPAQHFDKPGKSPFMDMELVPKYAETNESATSVNIDPAQVQNLGMRTTKVIRIAAQTHLETTASLGVNKRDLALVQLKAAGFVEKVWPLAVGDRVLAGQPIAEFSIPEWLTPQNEFLAVIANDNPKQLSTARTRLRLLGMPETLINNIEHTRKTVTHITLSAPINGVIESLDVKSGSAWQSGQTLVRIQGLDNLWLDAAIPEAQAQRVHKGDKVSFYASGIDSNPIMGTINSLLPMMDTTSRTLTARILLPNKNGHLTPGTSGRAVFHSQEADENLAVATEAIIHTGKRNLVMLTETAGHFKPVAVEIGAEVGSKTLIVSGLKEGQEVVASGQFLLDSEASLLGLIPDSEPMPAPSQMEMQP